MKELKSFNLDKLYKELFLGDDQFVVWLQNLGLLHKKRTCECGEQMRQQKPRPKGKHGMSKTSVSKREGILSRHLVRKISTKFKKGKLLKLNFRLWSDFQHF